MQRLGVGGGTRTAQRSNSANFGNVAVAGGGISGAGDYVGGSFGNNAAAQLGLSSVIGKSCSILILRLADLTRDYSSLSVRLVRVI
jgi:hypothetical protein